MTGEPCGRWVTNGSFESVCQTEQTEKPGRSGGGVKDSALPQWSPVNEQSV